MSDNIIPNFVIPEQKPPITVLREVATQLGRKTKNLVVGVVYSEQMPDEVILHGFDARAVALGDYTLPLFYVTHALLQPYEAKIYMNKTPAVAGVGEWRKCLSQSDFEQALKEIFLIPKIYGTIEAMLSQSRQIEMVP